MGFSWDSSISITTLLLALSPGFGDLKALLIVDLATNPLNGVAGTTTYATLADATTAFTATYISASTLAAITAWFAQNPHASEIKVAYWDLVGPVTAAATLTRIQAIDNDWYWVLTNQRGDTNMLAMATAIEALGTDASTGMKRFMGQSLATANTGTYPVALTTLQTMKRSAMVWHGTTTIWNDMGYVSKGSSFDQQVKSNGWAFMPLESITLPAVTSSEGGYLKTNNWNFLAPGGAFTAGMMGQGVGTDGTAIKSAITADLLTMLMRSRIATYLGNAALQGDVVGMDADGQAQILGVMGGVFTEMTAANHFVAGQLVAVAEAISSADRTAKRLRFTNRDQLVEQMLQTAISNYIQSDPVVE